MRTCVQFAKPGFFLGDSTVELWIDDRLGYRGSFRDGFAVWATLEPGPHAVRTAIALGPIQRSKSWTLEVATGGDPASHLAIELHYSRLWGNFKSRLTSAIAPGISIADSAPHRD